MARQIHGRSHAVKLIRHLMSRPEDRQGRLSAAPTPVVVFEAPPGGGKTALLEATAALVHQRVPYAHLDLAALQDSGDTGVTVADVLSALAFELARPCRRYGRLAFPRLVVGQIVRELDLDTVDPDQARRQVLQALRSYRRLDEAIAAIQATGDAALALARARAQPPVPDNLGNTLVSLVGDGLTRWMPRAVLGRHLSWWGHRDLGLADDPVAVLGGLNRWTRGPVCHQQRVESLLAAAFLADLRHGFQRGQAAVDGSLNCVLLLDNADADLGRSLLAQLVLARRDHRDQGCDPDPLTIVATSRGTLLDAIDAIDAIDDADLATASVVESSPTSHAPPNRNGPVPSWLRFPLPPLARDEVVAMMEPSGRAGGDNPVLARTIHDFTGGQPAATRALLDLLPADPAAGIWLTDILGTADRDGIGVEERLCRTLLGETPEQSWDDLATCAAARRRRHAVELVNRHEDLFACPALVEELLRNVPLWSTGEEPRPMVLRRLLLRRLAARDTDVEAGGPGWFRVHSLLRECCQCTTGLVEEPGAETRGLADELGYRLAAGEVGTVAGRLAECVPRLPVTIWLSLLAAVTSVPGRQDPGEDPAQGTQDLSGCPGSHSELRDCLAVLTANLWIAADPLRERNRPALHLHIAASYRELIRHCPNWSVELLAEEDHHRRLARQWSAAPRPRRRGESTASWEDR